MPKLQWAQSTDPPRILLNECARFACTQCLWNDWAEVLINTATAHIYKPSPRWWLLVQRDTDQIEGRKPTDAVVFSFIDTILLIIITQDHLSYIPGCHKYF